MSVERFYRATNDVWRFFVCENFVSDERNRWMEIQPYWASIDSFMGLCDTTGSTAHNISSLYWEYLQSNFPIFLSFVDDFSEEKLVKWVLCILVRQNTPELHANKWSNVLSSLSQKRPQILRWYFFLKLILMSNIPVLALNMTPAKSGWRFSACSAVLNDS